MKNSMKKSLAIAGVLATLVAGSAFAADHEMDAPKHNTTTTWQQDAKTQEQAMKNNAKFDEHHGYTNINKNDAKHEMKEIKKNGAKHEMREIEKKDAKKANQAWKKDVNTQEQAMKENAKFDKNHGYTNINKNDAKHEMREINKNGAKHEMRNIEKKDAQKANQAWRKDVKTQEQAMKENAKFDQHHGYTNIQKPEAR